MRDSAHNRPVPFHAACCTRLLQAVAVDFFLRCCLHLLSFAFMCCRCCLRFACTCVITVAFVLHAACSEHLQVDASLHRMQRQASRVARPARAYAATLHARRGDSGAKDAAERRILRVVGYYLSAKIYASSVRCTLSSRCCWSVRPFAWWITGSHNSQHRFTEIPRGPCS
jgi:hypothetical protein